MGQANAILAFIEAAWPVAAILAVVILGLIWASHTEDGRRLIVELALTILTAIAKGIEPETIDKLDRAADHLYRRMPPEARRTCRKHLP